MLNRKIFNTLEENYRLLIFFVSVIAVVAFFSVLKLLSHILIPVTFGVFLTYIFHPFVIYLTKKKVPQWVGVLLVLFIVILVIYLSVLFLSASVASLGDKGDFYLNRLETLLTAVLAPFNYSVTELMKLLKLQFDTNLEGTIKSILSTGIIQSVLKTLSGALNDLLITLFFFIFMISGKTEFDKKIRRVITNGKSDGKNLLITIESQIQQYLIIKTVISFLLAVVISIVYIWFGVDLAIFWGIVTFLFNYIPNIGAIFATAAPVLMIFLQFEFTAAAFFLVIFTVGIHFLSGNIIEPVYVGKYMDLSPVFVLFSLFFWGYLWGLPGMFLSVPIAAIIKIAFMNIEPLKKYAPLIGGKVSNGNA